MLYFFKTLLNEAYIANVSFAKSARTFIQSFIIYSEFMLPRVLFLLKKYLVIFAFLISQGTIFHILVQDLSGPFLYRKLAWR